MLNGWTLRYRILQKIKPKKLCQIKLKEIHVVYVIINA